MVQSVIKMLSNKCRMEHFDDVDDDDDVYDKAVDVAWATWLCNTAPVWTVKEQAGKTAHF